MGEDVHKDQIKYLPDTPKPTNFTTMEFSDRIAVINSSLVCLKKRGKAMTEEEVIERVISVNLKPNLMQNFILYKGDKGTTLKEVKQILCRIDCENAHTKQATEKLLKIKAKDNKGEREREKGKEDLMEREKSAVNMCQLKGHNHAWNKCTNISISKNFAGKLYTEVSASKRYENNFVKKAQIKKTAKEEREMKKRISINKGEVHYIDRADTQSVISADFDFPD
jgi:hypothetical protein